MKQVTPERLAGAVAAVCVDIAARLERNSAAMTERQLWWELSGCLLSSQVPYSLATAAADAIDESGLLMDRHVVEENLATQLEFLLSKPLQIESRLRAYRFPRSRAIQLAASRSAVTNTGGSLGSLLAAFPDAASARDWFVQYAPGIGPKQASMFLRNAGVSFDLAVLDRHVLSYMGALGLTNVPIRYISGMRQYRNHEATLRAHALRLGHPVGLLDWAIWIVMRVAQNLRQEPLQA